jgi:hypothetical protein
MNKHNNLISEPYLAKILRGLKLKMRTSKPCEMVENGKTTITYVIE